MTTMRKCALCQNPLSESNGTDFCRACQKNPKAMYPVAVIIQENGDVNIDWWSSVLELDKTWEEGQQHIPVNVSVQDLLEIREISDLLQEKAEETEGQFADSSVLSVTIPNIVKEAMKRI